MLRATSEELLLTSCSAMLQYLQFLVQLPATSRCSLAHAACYVRRTSFDFMLRYVAISSISCTTSSYVKMFLSSCCVLRQKNFFRLHAPLCCNIFNLLYNFQLRWDITALLPRQQIFLYTHIFFLILCSSLFLTCTSIYIYINKYIYIYISF